MLRFPLYKKLMILFAVLWGAAYALPNVLTPAQRQQLPAWMPHKPVNLGLDLQGGSHLVLEVDTPAAQKRAYENLEDEVRLALREGKDAGGERLGYRHVTMDEKGVSFTLSKPEQKDLIEKAIHKQVDGVQMAVTGDVATVSYTPATLQDMERKAVEQSLEILRSRVDEFGVAEPIIQRQGDRQVIVELPGIEDVARAKSIIGRTAQLTFHMVDEGHSLDDYTLRHPPEGKIVLFEKSTDPAGNVTQTPYLLDRKPALTGERLAGASSGFEGNTNTPAVFIKFDGVGTRKFGDLTTENVGKRMAIVLDGVVYSAPVLREPILGGSAVVSGRFTTQEADDLATVLRAGALPAPVNVLEERTVGPSLGQDSVDAGRMAIALGFCAVVGLVLLCYGRFGLAATAALFLNVVLVLAIMTALGATLTLPGMAGIVLVMGMAVDANVLIFERIRDEARLGRAPAHAIESGFDNAFGTILDANVTTLIASAILFAVGSGPVRGFALTLSVGVLSSMFTAVTVTRFLLVTWFNWRKPKVLPLVGAFSEKD